MAERWRENSWGWMSIGKDVQPEGFDAKTRAICERRFTLARRRDRPLRFRTVVKIF